MAEGKLDEASVRLFERAQGGSESALWELLANCREYLLLVANRVLDPDLRL